MSEYRDLYAQVMETDTDAKPWWSAKTIRRDLVMSKSDPIYHLPTSIVENLLKYKVVTNKTWDRQELEFLRDELVGPIVLEEKMIMFTDEDDMAAFLLKFRN